VRPSTIGNRALPAASCPYDDEIAKLTSVHDQLKMLSLSPADSVKLIREKVGT